MDKGSALDGFAALYDGTGNSAATILETVTTKCVLEYELVRLCQVKGDRPHKGTPLGRFPELWPFDLLKRPLVEHAQEFVRQIAGQGFSPLTTVDQFQVWGPYTEKVGEPHDWIPEEGNHLIPRHERKTATTAWGYRGDELNVEKGCAFLIQGKFTRAARHGHISEETGRILV